MRDKRRPFVIVLLAGLAGLPAGASAQISQPPPPQSPPAEAQRAWTSIAAVLTSPRCINCHPSSDRPTQTDAMRVHQMNVMRGPMDHGAVGLACSACHQERNSAASGVPGAPHWKLAPRSMGWVGLSSADLCRRLKDRSANGDRDLAALARHMTTDALVLWAWMPGDNARGIPRQPPPVSQDDLKNALAAWVAADGPCPD
jgi:hypothetical protein